MAFYFDRMLPTLTPRLSLSLLLALIALSWWSIYLTRPPQVKPATAPPTEFSAERAMQHVRQIAREPHAMGTPGHARVRAYLRLESDGTITKVITNSYLTMNLRLGVCLGYAF